MGTIGRFNLILERLMLRINGLVYLFKDRLKCPRPIVSLSAILLLSCAVAFAAIPQYINFQGRLTDSDGNPVANGSYTVTFRLYSAETGGTALWTEEQSVTVASGVFNAALGTETSLSGLAFDAAYWLSIQVGSDTEMTPRQRLTSAGYALNADNLDNITGSQFLRSDADDTASGQITLTYSGTALTITPSSAPSANSKLIDLQNTSGTTISSIDEDGDLLGANLVLTGSSDAMIYFGSEDDPTATITIDQTSGDMTFNKNLTVQGDQTIEGETTYEDALTVDGAFTVNAGNTVCRPEGQIDSTEIADATIAGGDLAADIAISTTGAITTTGANLTGQNLVLTGASNALISFGPVGSPVATMTIDQTTGNMTFNKSLTVQGDQTVTGTTIYQDDLTITGNFTVSAGNTVSLPSGQIDSTEIEDGSISTDDILNGTITADDLGTDSVAADEIAAGAVGTSEIDDGTITADDLGTDSVAADEMAADAVGTSEIDDGSIAGADLAAAIVIDTEGTINADGDITSDDGDLVGENLVLVGSSNPIIYLGSRDEPTALVTFDATTGDMSFNADLTANSITSLGGSPAALNFGSGANRISLIYDPDTNEIRFSRGVFAHDFRNLVKNGSFEAFSALEAFHAYDLDYASNTDVYNTTDGFQGGWESFAPDEWTYVTSGNGGGGKVFQQAPTYFKYNFNSDSISSTTYQEDFAEGRSAVRMIPDGSNPGMITQVLKGLKPSTLYSVGVQMRVGTSGYAKVDIVGEDTSTSTAINDPDGISDTETSEITVDSVSGFPAYGVIVIGSERISYGALDSSNNKFLRLARGIENTPADDHLDNVPVTIAPFNALTTDSYTTYTKFKSHFHSDNKGSNVTIKLSAEASGGYTGPAYFDTLQVVAGGAVPEYGPNTIVDSGDQTMYGSLRVGRASDDKGGILSVDKFVRTRGIELFTDDPGLSGATGGGGATMANTGIFPPGSGWNNTENQQPTVQLFTTGQYPTTSPSHRDYKVTVSDAANNEFNWWYMDNTTSWTYTTGGTDVAMTTNTNGTQLATEGVYVYFDSLATDVTGDTWWFSASNEEAYGGYDTYADTVSYVSGESRIYKDAEQSSPYYGKLVFEDGATRVSLEELAGSVSVATSGYIGDAYPYGNNSGGFSMNISGSYGGADSRNYYVKISDEGTYNASSDKFRWKKGVEDWYDHAEKTVSGTPVLLEDGIYVSFSENWDWGDSYYTAGSESIPDTWSFNVSPGSTATAQVTSLEGKTGAITFTGADGITIDSDNPGGQIIRIIGSGGGSGVETATTSASFTLDSDSVADPDVDQDLAIYFEDAANATAHSLTWDDGEDRFVFDDDLNVTGTISQGGVSLGDGYSLDADDGTPADALYVDAEGYVGIGTTSPLGRLDLKASTNDGTTNALYWKDSDGVGLGAIDSNGNIGIGTTGPSVKFDVLGQGKFTSTIFPVVDIYRDTTTAGGSIYGGAKLERLMTGGTATNGTGIGFYFKNPDSDGNSTYAGMFGGTLSTVTNGAEVGDIAFGAAWQGADPFQNQHLIIRATGASTGNVLIPNGNVGIGTSDPGSLLDVQGALTVGVDTTGYEVKFYGETTANYLLWDDTNNKLWVEGSLDADTITEGGSALTSAGDFLKDLVATSPITVNAGSEVNNILYGIDGDVTIAVGDALDDGATKGIASFAAADFTATSGNITLDKLGDLATTSPIGGAVNDIFPGSNGAKATITFDQSANFSWSGTHDLQNTLTIGQDTTGYEVKFYGETTANYLLWDDTNNKLWVEGSFDADTITEGGSALTSAGDFLKDLVATSPVTVNAGSEVNNILYGTDGDVTIAVGDALDDGATKGIASFAAADFGATSGNITLDKLGDLATTSPIGGAANDIFPGSNGAKATITFDQSVDFTWSGNHVINDDDGTDNENKLIIGDSNDLDNLIVYGKIGIGTTAPSEELDVDGDVRLSGRILQGDLGDLAEMMSLSSCITNPANVSLPDPIILARGHNEEEPVVLKNKEQYQGYLKQRPEAGDVVVIGEDGGIRRSFAPYATNTAGIISTNPAQILRDGLENAVAVALNGVVPCKATNENGTITPGDLLVASSLPGHAMRAGENVRPGSVIGKALSRLDKEVGVVEVLVMMK